MDFLKSTTPQRQLPRLTPYIGENHYERNLHAVKNENFKSRLYIDSG